MKKVSLLAGTSEGRRLAAFCAAIPAATYVSVATGYGESLIEPRENLIVEEGRMDADAMRRRWRALRPDFIIDATHPYAVQATANARAAAQAEGIPYLRVCRAPERAEGCKYFESTEEIVRFLNQKSGAVLLTTGTRSLAEYTSVTEYKKRVYARILPDAEGVAAARALGFPAAHLICMQGPFSVELNRAMMAEYHIKTLVTKESGAAGGFLEKCQGAQLAGADVAVLCRPQENGGLPLEQAEREIMRLLTGGEKT